MSKCQLKIRSTSSKHSGVSAYERSSIVLLWLVLLLPFLILFPSMVLAAVTDSNERFSTWYGYLYIGDNIGGANSDKLERVNYKSGGPPEWGIGIGRYLNDVVSVEGIFEYWGERYERKTGSVIPGTENNVIQVGGLGISIAAVFNYIYQDLHGYAGAGAGYYLTGILVTEPGTGLLTEKGAPSDKFLPGFHVSIGADYRIQEAHKIGVELKRRFLDADFGQYTNGSVEVGGTYLLFMYRHSWK